VPPSPRPSAITSAAPSSRGSALAFMRRRRRSGPAACVGCDGRFFDSFEILARSAGRAVQQERGFTRIVDEDNSPVELAEFRKVFRP
jgi:hypothetical protein